MKASFIIGFIALSAAILTFAAFAPAQQQTAQVRRVLTSAVNASVVCTFTNGTAVGTLATSYAYALSNYTNFTCTQTETDTDINNAVTTKVWFVNQTMSYMFSNMSVPVVMGMSNTSAGMTNVTVMMNYENQSTIVVQNATGTNVNATTNTTTTIFNVTMQTLINCSMTATATMTNLTSQYQCMNYMNSSTMYSMFNGSVNTTSATTMFLYSSVTNNTNMTMFYINYNQSNSSMFVAMANTSVMTYTMYTTN